MHSNQLYQAVEPYLETVILPKDSPTRIASDEYVQSRETNPESDPSETHPPEHVQSTGGDSASPLRLGFVERQLDAFIRRSPPPRTFLLIGMPGCGKTTTIRYYRDNLIAPAGPIEHIYLDLNDFLHSADQADRLATSFADGAEVLPRPDTHAKRLAESLSINLERFLTTAEEVKSFWTWAMTYDTAGEERQAKAVMFPVRQSLALNGISHDDESPRALDARQTIFGNMLSRMGFWEDTQLLEYQVLKIKYISEMLLKPRSKTLVVFFDNLDTLEPSTHTYLLELAVRIGRRTETRCVVTARPMSFLPWWRARKATHWTHIDQIEHTGPDITKVLSNRLRKHLLELDDASFGRALNQSFVDNPDRARPRVIRWFKEPAGPFEIVHHGLAIPSQWIRVWARSIHAGLLHRQRGPLPHGQTSPQSFFLGISGSSARAAFELFSKCLRSWAIPIDRLVEGPVDIFERTTIGGQQWPVLRQNANLPILSSDVMPVSPSEVIRAMLVDREDSYRNSNSRIVDNLFSCGRGGRQDIMCKVRLLQFLNHFVKDRKTLGELTQWFEYMEIEDASLREAILQLCAAGKRSLVLDSLPAPNTSLLSLSNNSVQISGVGRYYIDSLLYNVDYASETMRASDCPPPESRSPVRLVSRMKMTREFLCSIVSFDCIHSGRLLRTAPIDVRREFRSMCGGKLLSRRIADAWKISVVAQLRSFLNQYRATRHRPEHDEMITTEINSELNVWEAIGRSEIAMPDPSYTKQMVKLDIAMSLAEGLFDDHAL